MTLYLELNYKRIEEQIESICDEIDELKQQIKASIKNSQEKKE